MVLLPNGCPQRDQLVASNVEYQNNYVRQVVLINAHLIRMYSHPPSPPLVVCATVIA